MSQVIEYKNSIFYCDTCKKMVRGSGGVIPQWGKAYCSTHYKKAVAKLFKEEKNNEKKI